MTDFVFALSSGEEIPVIITTRRGVRNITLRPKIAPKREIHISKPWLVSNVAAIRFLKSKQQWVECVFDKCPQKINLQSGDILEFLGRRVTLIHNPSLRANRFDSENSVLYVGGSSDMFERRVRDYVKSEFLKQLKKWCNLRHVNFGHGELQFVIRHHAGAVVRPQVQCLFRGVWRLRLWMLCVMLLCMN